MARMDVAKKDAWKRRNCGDCFWLHTPFEGSSCSDGGQLEQSSACNSFEFADPYDWLKNSDPVLALREKVREHRMPTAIANEVKAIQAMLTRVNLPRRLKENAEIVKLQQAVADSSAHRARLTELIRNIALVRARLVHARIRCENEVLGMSIVKAVKQKNERDTYLSVACRYADSKVAQADQLIAACRENIKTCDDIKAGADLIIRAAYVLKDKV